MAPLLWALVGAVTAWGGYKVLKKEPNAIRFVGDLAVKGDEIEVSPAFLSGQLPPEMPKTTTFVIVKVLGGDKDRIQGPIVGWQDLPKTAYPVGSFVVQRKDLYKVTRDGKILGNAVGATVTGEGFCG